MEQVLKTDNSVKMVGASDIGKVREENEDYYLYSEDHRFFVVCDGMGGHQTGAMASRLAGETLGDIFMEKKNFDLKKICSDISTELPLSALKLIAGIRLANRRIFSYSRYSKDLRGMGTTIAAIAIEKGLITIAHVGDSRVYRLRDDTLTCLTSDHSWLNELLEDNEISRDQIHQFKKKNILTRALGTDQSVKIDLFIDAVQTDDLYLLCSDGLHNALQDDVIESILKADLGPLQNKINKLVESAKLLNGSDNITGGLIHINCLEQSTEASKSYFETIKFEPPKVSNFLERTVKSLYPDSRKKGSLRTPLIIGILVLSILLAGFLILSIAGKP